MSRIKAVWIGHPSCAAGCDARDAERNSVAFAEFLFAVLQQLRKRPVDVAEAEEAEVVGANADFLARGLNPD